MIDNSKNKQAKCFNKLITNVLYCNKVIKLSESRIKVKIINREEWGKFYGIDKPTISNILHDVPDDVLIRIIIVKK